MSESQRTLRSILVGQSQCLPLPWQNKFLASNEWLLNKIEVAL